jgi:hypothetical protein
MNMKNLIRKILKEELEWLHEVPKLSEPEKFIYEKLSSCVLFKLKKHPGWTKYINPDGKILFVDNIETGTRNPVLYADYIEIWEKCEEMGMKIEDFKKTCTWMLEEAHKRKVVTTILDLEF